MQACTYEHIFIDLLYQKEHTHEAMSHVSASFQRYPKMLLEKETNNPALWNR